MTTNEGENRPTQLSTKEFVRAIRELYVQTPRNVLSPFESLSPEEREAEDDMLQKRIGGEYRERLMIRVQEVLAAAPYLSQPLKVFIKKEFDGDSIVGVLDETENQPLPEKYKGLYEILRNDLPIIEELESDDGILRHLEISCYRVELARHKADKERLEERIKKRIPSPPEDLIRIYGKRIENEEKDLGEWRSLILERFEEDPEQPTQPSEQTPLI